jgi:exopolyphosphatase / guanosine-5'-triphosphate,3'-diphosphate pyrophosphatase
MIKKQASATGQTHQSNEKPEIFGAIDIGSNAVRGMAGYIKNDKVKKTEKKRIALRLGAEVLQTGRISNKSVTALTKAIAEIADMFSRCDVTRYRACATESLRIAENGIESLKKVQAATGIKISLIDGREEAMLIYSEKIARKAKSGRNIIFADVGGGSTDLVLHKSGEAPLSRSFKIGTLRTLTGKTDEDEWGKLFSFIGDKDQPAGPWDFYGSGGNIRALRKLSKKKKKHSLKLEELEQYYREMQPLSVQERMEKWNFRPDRADVIVPALEIFIRLMQSTGMNEVYVPGSNLSNAIIWSLRD